MKVLSPLTGIEELRPLLKAGADEFYCGLISKREAINDRPNTLRFNFQNINELAEAVKIARDKKKNIFLVVNNLTPSLTEAVKQARIAEKLGMTGVIVANLLLMKKINELKLNLSVSASCLTAVLNSEAVKFIKNLGAKTIHLPRQIGIKELENLAKKSKDIGLSVFGFNGMCINIEAFCSLHYLKEEYFLPCRHFKVIKCWGSNQINRCDMNKKINSPPLSCGICAFKRLKEAGIESIKIEGRGCDMKDKIGFVKIAREAIDRLSQVKESDKEYQKFCRGLFKKYFNNDCKIEYCYF